LNIERSTMKLHTINAIFELPVKSKGQVGAAPTTNSAEAKIIIFPPARAHSS